MISAPSAAQDRVDLLDGRGCRQMRDSHATTVVRRAIHPGGREWPDGRSAERGSVGRCRHASDHRDHRAGHGVPVDPGARRARPARPVRGHRPRRSERGRQDDADLARARPARADRRHRSRCSASTPPYDGPELRAQIGYGPERNVFPDDCGPTTSFATSPRSRGLPRDEARQPGQRLAVPRRASARSGSGRSARCRPVSASG